MALANTSSCDSPPYGLYLRTGMFNLLASRA